MGDILTKIPVSLQKNVLNYEPRLLDIHDPKVDKVIGDSNFKSRGPLNALKSAWDFRADEDMLSEALSLFDHWTGDKDDLLVNLGNYFWSVVPGMNRELWTKLESLAVKRGIFTKGGYMDVREYIKEEGRQEGWQKGQQDGIQKGMQQVASNMLKKHLDFSLISAVTGLSEEKLKNGS